MQNKELFRKQQKTSYSKKEYKFPSGKIVTVQGYENLALDILIKQYKEEDIFTSEELPNYVSDIDYINENDKQSLCLEGYNTKEKSVTKSEIKLMELNYKEKPPREHKFSVYIVMKSIFFHKI